MEKKIIKIGKYQLDYNPDNEGTRKPPYTITYNKDGRDNAFVVKNILRYRGS